jgi:hypothetical protein
MKDLDELEQFFGTADIGKGFDLQMGYATIEITRDYIEELLRLLRLNAVGAKNEKYGLAWLEVLLALKQHLTDKINSND